VAGMVSISKGKDPEYYTQAAKGPEYYSAGAGIDGLEPDGIWTGDGCPDLGLVVGMPIDKGVFLRLFGEHADPRDGRRLGRAMPVYKKDWQEAYRALLQAEPAATAQRREELKAQARDQAVPWRRIYQGLLAAEPGATAERRAELRTQAMAQVRQAVPYFDATFSPSKDVSVLHASFLAASVRAGQAGDAAEAARLQDLAGVVWAAVLEGNQAMLDHFQEHAGYTRSGSHARKAGRVSTGRWEDAHQFVVASFRQHTSRNGDPQLHVHNTILNRVQRERDGAWRSLDGVALYRERGAAAAVAALVMENALARKLGVEFTQRRDGHGRSIRGIPEKLVDAFSTRTRQDIEGRLPELIEGYRLRFGRDPDARALYGLRHRATLVTRVRKEPGLSLGQQVAQWAQTARRADGEALEPVAGQVCGRLNGTLAPEPGRPLSRGDELNLMRQALAAVAGRQNTWTRSALTRALGELLPASVGVTDSAGAKAYLQGLADRALGGEAGEVVALQAPEFPAVPAGLRRADGESMFRPHYAARYATGIQLSMEERILQIAGHAGREIPRVEPEPAARLLGSETGTLEAQLDHETGADVTTVTGSGLYLDQAAAAYHILTSLRRAEVLTGPAGTGKTRTVATIARCWQAAYPGARVIGLTTSQQARHVLHDAGVTDSFNIARWLSSPGQPAIPPGSLIILDEASMTAMHHFDAVLAKAKDVSAKVVIAGDPHQLGAVERGGGMLMLSRHLGHVQLAEPMRFASPWERQATLRLRAGDVSILGEYDQHGRLVSGTKDQMMDQAYRAWLADYLEGKHSVLIAHDQADADEMGRRARGDLKHLGKVSGTGEVRLRDGAQASPGDRIMARKNNTKQPVGIPGRTLTNRDILQVLSTGADGIRARLLVGRADDGTERWGEPFPVRREYLARECHLAYAVTAHATEGSTYDENSYCLIRPQDTREYAYTALSRARVRNAAFVVADPLRSDTDGAPEPDPEIARYRRLERERDGLSAEGELDQAAGSAIAVLAEVLGRSEQELSARETRWQAYSDEDHLARLGSRWLEFVKEESVRRFGQVLRKVLPADLAEQALADHAVTWLARSLREAELAGLDGTAVLARAAGQRDMTGVRDPARVLDARVRQLLENAQPVTGGRWARRAGELTDTELNAYWHAIGQAIDTRIQRLGEYTAVTAPLWATRALGPVPGDPQQRAVWEDRASVIAAYREMWGYENPGDAIGPEPSRGSPEARAAWRAALAVLGEIDGIDLRHLSDGDLLLRRGTYQHETAWAPEYVADKLRLMKLTQADAQTRAVRAAFEAKTATDEGARARHEQLARIWRSLEVKASEETALFEHAQQVRAAWEETTEPTRRIAMAADAELRKRHPDLRLDPLTSAEPASLLGNQEPTLTALGLTPQTAADPVPELMYQISQAARQAQETLDRIRSMPEPGADEDELSPGEAWARVIGRQRESVLQPAVELVPPAPEIAGYDEGREAGW
jgi:TrwC relaxase/AAA domain